MISGITFTPFAVEFDITAILLMLLGILMRFMLEWYKTSKDKSVPYDINWRGQAASSMIAVLAYIIIVLLAAHKLTSFEALILGLAPQSIINEFNNIRESAGGKPILTPESKTV